MWDTDPETDEGIEASDRIARRLGRRNVKLRDGLTAWAEVLDTLGWCAAIRQSRRPPHLSPRAVAWFEASGVEAPRTWNRLVEALDQVPESGYWIHDDQLRVWDPEASRKVSPAAADCPNLSRREAEVLHWLKSGKTGPEIALILGCAPRTVESHVARIYKKLGVHNRSELLFRTSDPDHVAP